jgi:hypothetical protein
MSRALLVAALLASGCYDPHLRSGGFACDPVDQPACPAGQVCVDGRCAAPDAPPPPLHVAKTGAAYMGQRVDPGLTSASDCPAASLEPDDGTGGVAGQPVVVPAAPDATTAKLTNLAICPTGPNAATGAHDVDWYRVDATAGGAVSLVAEVFYEITYGDLDVAIVDANGTHLAEDGTAQSNACAAATIGPGVYYVVVVGAGDTDVNHYELRVRTYSKPTGCNG